MSHTNNKILPGMRLSLGFTLVYLSLLLAIPLIACVAKTLTLSPEQFLAAVWSERARSAYALTFGASGAAACLDLALGSVIAWVLVRYQFPLKRLLDSLVDLPFALPTAVAGLVYSNLYVQSGWFGRFLVPLGFEGAYSRLAIVLVLTFIGLPFVVRALQPVLESIDTDAEEAAGSLGANRWQTFWRVIFPALRPAMATGFALAFARSLGEYGSVVFVSGNMPFKTEIAPVLIVSQLEGFAYREATAIAIVLLLFSFLTLALINVLERWSAKCYVVS